MLTKTDSRSLSFCDRSHNRYWWFHATGCKYIPPVFEFLNEDEWEILSNWYDDTEKKFQNPGECAVPLISFIFGFVTGNNVSRIVQLGHYAGFSTLLIGFMLRKMNHKHSLFSIDIDPEVTEYTAEFVSRAGLDDHVKLSVNDSSDLKNIQDSIEYLDGAPQIVFIDSSHQYQHTLKELNLWYHNLRPGGFILMHDVSNYAASFDSTKEGGVYRAIKEWIQQEKIENSILINHDNLDKPINDLIYMDGCGLGIIQKPLES